MESVMIPNLWYLLIFFCGICSGTLCFRALDGK
jgi:hypothetical protein